MLEAVLFDWGDTLMRFAYDESLVDAGHDAGLRAVGADRLPEAQALSAHFRERYLPLLHFWDPGMIEEIDYPELIRECFSDLGFDLDDAQLEAFLEAEHAAWQPARELGATTHALLELLRARGLKLAVVSNAFDPPSLLHRDLEQMGIAQRVDVAVFSSEVGLRKPHRSIFDRALERLGVAPESALFVGDRLYEDVRGAGEVGMKTMQAVWFRADEHADGGVPDFVAVTQMDVLNVARRLLGER